MSRTLDIVRQNVDVRKLRQAATARSGSFVESSTLVTSAKTLVVNNTAEMTSRIFGDVVWNIAKVFDTEETNVYTEVTCTADGLSVILEQDDNVNGKYIVVSYLSVI